ncbi:hypothetical protein STEG23_029440, partial [Scotinomys teguina]
MNIKYRHKVGESAGRDQHYPYLMVRESELMDGKRCQNLNVLCCPLDSEVTQHPFGIYRVQPWLYELGKDQGSGSYQCGQGISGVNIRFHSHIDVSKKPLH